MALFFCRLRLRSIVSRHQSSWNLYRTKRERESKKKTRERQRNVHFFRTTRSTRAWATLLHSHLFISSLKRVILYRPQAVGIATWTSSPSIQLGWSALGIFVLLSADNKVQAGIQGFFSGSRWINLLLTIEHDLSRDRAKGNRQLVLVNTRNEKNVSFLYFCAFLYFD